jgi:hypothetical protein
MADTKISALTGATTPLAGTEVIPVVQGGQTRKVSIDNLTAGRPISTTQLNVDNLRLDGNTISSQDINGVINLLPNGTTGDVRATTRLRFQSNAQNSDGALASYRVSLSTVATDISAYDGTWGHLAIVTGLGGAGGDFFTDLVFSSATAGPTVLSSKTISGAPAARTYSMSGSSKLQLAMASGTYDVRSAILYGLQ